MSSFVNLRGLAAPYDKPAWLEDELESVAPASFAVMLSRPYQVAIRHRGHGGEMVANGVNLFETIHGLAFSAAVPVEAWGRMQWDIERLSYDEVWGIRFNADTVSSARRTAIR